MEKPVDLIILDTKQEVVRILNSSGLPLSVISLIMTDLTNGINNNLTELQAKQRADYSKLKEESENPEPVIAE